MKYVGKIDQFITSSNLIISQNIGHQIPKVHEISFEADKRTKTFAAEWKKPNWVSSIQVIKKSYKNSSVMINFFHIREIIMKLKLKLGWRSPFSKTTEWS